MFELHLPDPDNLKGLEYLIGLIPALISTVIIYHLKLRMVFADSKPETEAGTPIMKRIMLRWQRTKYIAILMTGAFMIGFLILTIPIYLLIDHNLTARVAIIRSDNTAYTRQIFICNKEYGDLPGKGNYIVNRADYPVVIFSGKDVNPATATPDTVAPHSLVAVTDLPQTYIQGFYDESMPIDLPDDRSVIVPLPIYKRISASAN